MLELKGVHTYYGDSHILQGVDLSVGRSQCVAILGRNGAGKTTTLRSIVGLTPCRRGEITFEGTSVSSLPTYKIVRNGIATVLRSLSLMPMSTLPNGDLTMRQEQKRHTRRTASTYP